MKARSDSNLSARTNRRVTRAGFWDVATDLAAASSAITRLIFRCTLSSDAGAKSAPILNTGECAEGGSLQSA